MTKNCCQGYKTFFFITGTHTSKLEHLSKKYYADKYASFYEVSVMTIIFYDINNCFQAFKTFFSITDAPD